MTDAAIGSLPVPKAPVRRDIGLKRRYAAETRFRWYGIAAILFGLLFLAIMLVTIVGKGYTSFMQTSVLLPITFDAAVIKPEKVDPLALGKLAQACSCRQAGHFTR